MYIYICMYYIHMCIYIHVCSIYNTYIYYLQLNVAEYILFLIHMYMIIHNSVSLDRSGD